MESIIDDLAITCDEIIESYNDETNYYILLAFSIITIVLLIAVSIYCCLIKYNAKHKHSLPFQFKNNRLKKSYIKNIKQK